MRGNSPGALACGRSTGMTSLRVVSDLLDQASELGDCLLNPLEVGVLADAQGSNEACLRKHLEVHGCRGRRDPELLRNVEAAYAFFFVDRLLRPEMLRRLLQPFEDLQALRVGQRTGLDEQVFHACKISISTNRSSTPLKA